MHGQPAEFLVAALQDYAHSRRKSGIMQPVAAELTEDSIGKLAQYYARLNKPAPAGAAIECGKRTRACG